MVAECMEIDDYVQNIVIKLDSKDVSQVLRTIVDMKNLIIGNNKFKTLYAQDEIIIKLIELISKHQSNCELINEILITIGSFLRGNGYHLRKLVERHLIHEFLLHLLCSIDYNRDDFIKIIESCLRCLKNIYSNSFLFEATTSIYEPLYEKQTLTILVKLINLTNITRECVISIFSNTCETKEQQNLLISHGSIPNFASLLSNSVTSIQLSTLKFFTALCYSNKEAAKIILNTVIVDRSLCEIIAAYLSRDKQIELQLYASKCLTNLYRCDVIDSKNPLILNKTLPTLIRLCQKNIPNYILIQSIATLTYLIELSADLQEIASFLEQIVSTLAHYIVYYSSSATTTPPTTAISNSSSNKNITASTSSIDLQVATKGTLNDKKIYNKFLTNNLNEDRNSSNTDCLNNKLIYLKTSSLFNNITLFYNNFYSTVNTDALNINLRLASISFQALAALAANNEEVRRRISDQEGLMNRLVESIQQNNDLNLRLGALSLLHSLSRSVQQLRTKFLDHKVWTPIIDLIQSNDIQLICITAAILSNLLLEFSPSKETMIEFGVINILVKLVDHQNISIKINTMWALMNMAFQADQKVKQQILSTITMEKIFQLLTEQDDNLIMKTLGLLRNLICTKIHIDQLMSTHGTKVMQAIIMILEGDYSNLIKEQALCILSNIADGNNSKEYIMGNEDLLRKINSFMTHNCLQLQIAAVFCVSNLVWSTDDGANERQTKLKEMGVQRILRKLLESTDAVLLDKVKNSLQQFS